MLWDKKGGWQWEKFLGLVLVLVAGAVLIWIVVSYYADFEAEEKTERLACRASVSLNSKRLSILGIKGDPFIDVKCETIPLEIEEKDSEKIKKILADRLYWTWVDFGEGLREIYNVEFIGDTFCRQRYSPISFEYEVEVNNFRDFLANNKPESSEESYLTLITGRNGVEEFENIPDNIDTTKEYDVVFVISKKGAIARVLLGMFGNDFTTSLALIPSGELKELGC